MVEQIRVATGISAATPTVIPPLTGVGLVAYAWDGTGTAAAVNLPAGTGNDAYDLSGSYVVDLGDVSGLIQVNVTLTIRQPPPPAGYLRLGTDLNTAVNGIQMTVTNTAETVYQVAALPRRMEYDIADPIFLVPPVVLVDPAGVYPDGCITYSGHAAFTTTGPTTMTFEFHQGIGNLLEAAGPPPEAQWHGTIVATFTLT